MERIRVKIMEWKYTEIGKSLNEQFINDFNDQTRTVEIREFTFRKGVSDVLSKPVLAWAK